MMSQLWQWDGSQYLPQVIRVPRNRLTATTKNAYLFRPIFNGSKVL